MNKSSSLITAETIARESFKAEQLWGFDKAKHFATNIMTCKILDSLDGEPLTQYETGVIAEAIKHFQLTK